MSVVPTISDANAVPAEGAIPVRTVRAKRITPPSHWAKQATQPSVPTGGVAPQMISKSLASHALGDRLPSQEDAPASQKENARARKGADTWGARKNKWPFLLVFFFWVILLNATLWALFPVSFQLHVVNPSVQIQDVPLQTPDWLLP